MTLAVGVAVVASVITVCGVTVWLMRPLPGRPASGAASHVQQLLLCLPVLRQVDPAVKQFWINTHNDNKIHMDKLFVEMLQSQAR